MNNLLIISLIVAGISATLFATIGSIIGEIVRHRIHQDNIRLVNEIITIANEAISDDMTE